MLSDLDGGNYGDERCFVLFLVELSRSVVSCCPGRIRMVDSSDDVEASNGEFVQQHIGVGKAGSALY